MDKRLKSSATIRTYTGRSIDLLRPKPEDLCIEDIAHSLSRIPRFNGHLHWPYSVAEHCLHASRLVPGLHALWALLHDVSEAYLCDLPRPLKDTGRLAGYMATEAGLMAVVVERFGLKPGQIPFSVRKVDRQLCVMEQDELFSEKPPVSFWCLSPDAAEQQFLERFEELRAPPVCS